MCTMLINDRRHTVLRLNGIGCCIGVEQVTPIAPAICEANGWREVFAGTTFEGRPVVAIELPVAVKRSHSGRWNRLCAVAPLATLSYRSDDVHIQSFERLMLLRKYIESTDRRWGRDTPFLQQLPKSILKASARPAVLRRIDALIDAHQPR